MGAKYYLCLRNNFICKYTMLLEYVESNKVQFTRDYTG